MAAYRVEYSDKAARQLARIPDPHRTRIAHHVTALAKNPRPAGMCKLRGADRLYRIRVGGYRVLYEIHDRIVTIVIAEVGTRGAIYRNL